MYEEQEILSFAVQLICVIATIWLSVKYRKKSKSAVLCSAAVMFVGNLVGQGVIMQGGPGFCVGFILMPILGVIISGMTIIMIKVFFREV